jgi:hypothetical protein
MKLTLNIVRKDFLRLRWIVAGAWAVTALKFALGWWLMLGPVPEFSAWRELPKVVAVLVALEAIMAWLLTGMLVLEDPLVGTEPQWRTRPIAGARLLGAKLIGALAMLGVPVLVFGVPWWVFHGFGMRDMVPAAALGLALQVGVILPSMWVASVVNCLARFVVWSTVGVPMLMAIPLAMFAVLAQRMNQSGSVWWATGAAGLTTALGAVVVWQYRCGRNARRFVATAFVATALGAAGGGLAGWWLQSVGLGLWEDRNATRVVGLRAAWKNTTVVDAVTAREPFARVVSHLVFQGQPADCTVDLGSAEHVWTWANGQLIRQKGWGWASGAVRAGMLGLRPEELDDETQHWLEAQDKILSERLRRPAGLVRAVPEAAAALTASTGVAVQPSIAAKLRTEPSYYVMRTQLRISRAQSWFEVPRIAGEQQAANGYRLRIAETTEQRNSVSIRWVESHPAVNDFSIDANYGWMRALRSPDYVGVDRETGRLVPIRGDISASVMVAGVLVQARSSEVVGPRVVRNGKWTVVDPEWARRMRIMLVGWEEVARITREVTIDSFIADAPGAVTR